MSSSSVMRVLSVLKTYSRMMEFLINTKQISPALTESGEKCIATKRDKFPRRVFVAEGLSKNF